ncbi:MAG TPA: isoprenylcysteine carboxylmethyltransferase family protein [Vicinamibacterales bacterium]|nr:isoprenylcysteine carboxylmethyltransferase family protein [Vicinamibacterales bacterium]
MIALPPVLYAGAFLIVVVLQVIAPLRITTFAVGVTAGLALIAAGLALARWGRRTMVAAGTNVNPTLPSTAVVTSGPFRYTRNPLYVALTLFFLGLTLIANSYWGVVALAPLLVVMHFGVVRREERYLERKFGDGYRRYQSTVRRYF